MKSKILGIFVAVTIAVAWGAAPVWCQDQGQSTTTETGAQPAALTSMIFPLTGEITEDVAFVDSISDISWSASVQDPISGRSM